MSKVAIFITLFVLLVAGGVGYLLIQNDDEPAQTDQSTVEVSEPTETEPKTDADTQESTASEGSYIEYSESNLASADGQRIIFFHASWCPQCRAADQDIQQKGVPEGYTILKADYDKETSLKKKYGVTQQTTFVKIDEDGDLVDSFVAYSNPTLQAVKDNLF